LIAVAAAGPISNLVLMVLCALVIKVMTVVVPMSTIQSSPLLFGMGGFFAFMIYINTILAVFNLMPIPPLDGFHILTNTMHPESKVVKLMEEYKLALFFVAIFVIFQWIIGPAFSLVMMFLKLIHVAQPFHVLVSPILG